MATAAAFVSLQTIGCSWPQRVLSDTLVVDTVTRTAQGAGNDAYTQHNAMAVARFTTPATELRIELRSDTGTGHSLGVYVNGVWNQAVTPDTVDSKGRAKIITLAAGLKTVEIYEATGMQTGPIATWLQAVTGIDIAPAAPTNITRRLSVYSDSIGGGTGSTIPARDGWFPLMRQDYPGRAMLEAYVGRTLNGEADLNVLAALLVAGVAGASTREILINIGVNDYAGNVLLATFSTKLAALADAIHTADSGVRVVFVSPLTKLSEVANANGDTLGAFRTVYTTVQSTRTAWSVLLDGSTALSVGNLSGDGIHPNDAGHAQVKAAFKVRIGY